MSCWICSEKHVAAVAYGISEWYGDCSRNWSDSKEVLYRILCRKPYFDYGRAEFDYSYRAKCLYEVLHGKNVEAFTGRYGKGPGDIGDGEDYTPFEWGKMPDVGEDMLIGTAGWFMLLACFKYQCTETPVCESEWYSWLETIEHRMMHSFISSFQEYKDAPWGL